MPALISAQDPASRYCSTVSISKSNTSLAIRAALTLRTNTENMGQQCLTALSPRSLNRSEPELRGRLASLKKIDTVWKKPTFTRASTMSPFMQLSMILS